MVHQYNATVVRVIDGDTIRFAVDLGFYLTSEQSFRLTGVDAPELRGDERAAGLRAKKRVEELLPAGSVVKIYTYKTEKYGRWLVRVFADDLDVSSTLLKEGLAKPYGR